MKSQRRHELEKNELADWIAKVYKRFQPYEKLVLGVVIVALVVLVVYSIGARWSSARSAEGWTRFDEALSLGVGPTNFENVAEEYPNSDAGHWAAVMAADAYLAAGCEQLFVNKADAFRDLKAAVGHYMRVLDRSGHRMIRERATWGLARALEAMARDRKELDRAAEQYEKIFTEWPEGAYAEAARRRYEDLNRPSTLDVYQRFAKYEPKPAFQDEPGTPGERPPFNIDSLPDDAPLFEPSIDLDLDGPSSAMPEPAEPGAGEAEPGAGPPVETPPEEEVPPAEAAPEEAPPPADSVPEEAPSEDTPPEKTPPVDAP
jgi:hypothetical protein